MMNQAASTTALRIAARSRPAFAAKIPRAATAPAATFSTLPPLAPRSTVPIRHPAAIHKLDARIANGRTGGLTAAYSRAHSTASSKRGLAPILKQQTSINTATRFSSSSSSSSTSTTVTAGRGGAAAAEIRPQQQLDWNTFFALRKTRRRIQVAFSAVGALGCLTAGSWAVAAGVAEPLVRLIPLDPFITMGIIAMVSTMMGWLLGPIFGSAVFNVWQSRVRLQMMAKEKQFFARIKKNRVDPSTSSVGNPVPDFYGEKISSVAGYRQWLKDQRAFNKKRTTFL